MRTRIGVAIGGNVWFLAKRFEGRVLPNVRTNSRHANPSCLPANMLPFRPYTENEPIFALCSEYIRSSLIVHKKNLERVFRPWFLRPLKLCVGANHTVVRGMVGVITTDAIPIICCELVLSLRQFTYSGRVDGLPRGPRRSFSAVGWWRERRHN